MTSAPPTNRPARLRHAWLFALPAGKLPDLIACNSSPRPGNPENWRLVETFKHDFFAATGLYRRDAGDQDRTRAADPASRAPRAVLKMNRVGDFFGLPLLWAGRGLARREIAFYRAVQDLPGVPALLGAVGQTGLLHAYVPGHPLGRYEQVSDTFFDELLALVRALHARDIAYVDLNKRQNILMGDDARPYLIDFQISLRLPARGLGRLPPLRWLLRRFQHGDIYHVLKHKRRLRPDLLTPAEAALVERLSIWIRLHRAIARPLTQLRRRILRGLQRGEKSDVAGAGAK